MKIARIAGLALALLPALAWPQAGIVHGQTARGDDYLVGGIGEDEVSALRLARSGYGLSVQTAARGTGAWLADVRVRIADAQGNVVFDQALAGPWLLIRLQPGPYAVQATRGADVQSASVTVAAGRTHQQMFYFDAPESRPADTLRFPPATR